MTVASSSCPVGYKKVHWAFSHLLCRMGRLPKQGLSHSWNLPPGWCLTLGEGLWESWPPVQGSDGLGVVTSLSNPSSRDKSFKATLLQKHWASVTLSMAFGHRKKTVFGRGNLVAIWTFPWIYPWGGGWLGFWIYAALGIEPKTCVSQRLSHWSTDSDS